MCYSALEVGMLKSFVFQKPNIGCQKINFVFIEQCYDCHYFKVCGQWTQSCIQTQQHVANISHVYSEAGRPLGYYSGCHSQDSDSQQLYINVN